MSEQDAATAAATLEQDIARLRWQCRRGMLELDLLFGRFLDAPAGYAALDESARIDFVRLLGYEDQILYEWVMGQAVPAAAEMRVLIERIRAVQGWSR